MSAPPEGQSVMGKLWSEIKDLRVRWRRLHRCHLQTSTTSNVAAPHPPPHPTPAGP